MHRAGNQVTVGSAHVDLACHTKMVISVSVTVATLEDFSILKRQEGFFNGYVSLCRKAIKRYRFLVYILAYIPFYQVSTQLQ